MIDILVLIAAAILTTGAITDIRTREVPDWVNYAGIAAGFGIRVIIAALAFSWQPLVSGLLGFGAFYLLGIAMFYLGQWGGGDSKMLMAMGALLGLEFRPDHITVAFVTNLLFVGAAYGSIWTAALAAKHWSKVSATAHNLLVTPMYRKARAASLLGGILLAGLALLAPANNVALAVVLVAVTVPLMFYMTVAVQAVDKSCLQRRVKPNVLTEGDWLVHDVLVDGKRVAGPKDLGVTKGQIRRLVQAADKGKLRTVLMKIGMPFVPSFFLAFLAALAFGNLALRLLALR